MIHVPGGNGDPVAEDISSGFGVAVVQGRERAADIDVNLMTDSRE
jgi:hypothetical protein